MDNEEKNVGLTNIEAVVDNLRKKGMDDSHILATLMDMSKQGKIVLKEAEEKADDEEDEHKDEHDDEEKKAIHDKVMDYFKD